MKHLFRWALLIAIVGLASPAKVMAQADGVIVFDDDALLEQVTANGRKLLDAKQLVPLEMLVKQLSRPRCKLELEPARTLKLNGSAVFDIARRGTLIVGLLARDPDTSEWYFNAATGFILTSEGAVATCYHVLHNDDDHAHPKKEHEKKDEQKAGQQDSDSDLESKAKPGSTEAVAVVEESYLIAADYDGHVYPVLEVLAADKISDTCILKIRAQGLAPLPLNPDTRPGETVFCFSNPSDMFGHLSQGIISRFFVVREGLEPTSKSEVSQNAGRPVCFLSITSDFAVGSSGGPILDDRGNVVGQVQSTSSIFADPDEEHPKHPQMVVKAALTVREILKLIEQPKGELLARTPGAQVRNDPNVIPAHQVTVAAATTAGHEEPQTSSLPPQVPASRIALHFNRIRNDYESEATAILKQLETANTDERLLELKAQISQVITKTERRCFRFVNTYPQDPAALPALEFLVMHSELHQARALELLFKYHITSPEIGKTCVYFMNTRSGPQISSKQLENLTRAVIKHNCHREAVGLATLTLAKTLARRILTSELQPEIKTEYVRETQTLLARVMRHFAHVLVPHTDKFSALKSHWSNDVAGTAAERELNQLHDMTRRDLEYELQQRFFFDHDPR